MTGTPASFTPPLPRKQASFQVITATLSPASVAANTTAEQTFTVTGLLPPTATTPGDLIFGINKPTTQAGIGICGMRVSAADTLAITFNNNTAGAIVPTASQVYVIGVMRQANLLTTMDG